VPAVFVVKHPPAATISQVEPENAPIVSEIIDHTACDDEGVIEDFNLLAAAEASPMGHIKGHCYHRPSMDPSLLLHRLLVTACC
jgi:hypothetical protein